MGYELQDYECVLKSAQPVGESLDLNFQFKQNFDLTKNAGYDAVVDAYLLNGAEPIDNNAYQTLVLVKDQLFQPVNLDSSQISITATESPIIRFSLTSLPQDSKSYNFIAEPSILYFIGGFDLESGETNSKKLTLILNEQFDLSEMETQRKLGNLLNDMNTYGSYTVDALFFGAMIFDLDPSGVLAKFS